MTKVQRAETLKRDNKRDLSQTTVKFYPPPSQELPNNLHSIWPTNFNKFSQFQTHNQTIWTKNLLCSVPTDTTSFSRINPWKEWDKLKESKMFKIQKLGPDPLHPPNQRKTREKREKKVLEKKTTKEKTKIDSLINNNNRDQLINQQFLIFLKNLLL